MNKNVLEELQAELVRLDRDRAVLESLLGSSLSDEAELARLDEVRRNTAAMIMAVEKQGVQT